MCFASYWKRFESAKMSNDDPLYFVIDFILNKATSAELEVVAEALKRRTADTKGFGGLSPRSMAQNMARNVEKQLGGSFDAGTIARKIVSDLVRQKEPAISDEELEVLLNNWLPGQARRQQAQGPAKTQPSPPDPLVGKVATYLAAEFGSLSAQETRELPADWKAHYWESFPVPVRALIQERLQNRITEIAFWERLIASLQR
jgi:hypothetical protein